MAKNNEREIWFKERKQDRRCLEYHLRARTYGKVQGSIKQDVMRMMKARDGDELEAVVDKVDDKAWEIW